MFWRHILILLNKFGTFIARPTRTIRTCRTRLYLSCSSNQKRGTTFQDLETRVSVPCLDCTVSTLIFNISAQFPRPVTAPLIMQRLGLYNVSAVGTRLHWEDKTKCALSDTYSIDTNQVPEKRTTHASASLTYVGAVEFSRAPGGALSKNQCSHLGLTAESEPSTICSHPNCLREQYAR